MRIAVVCADLGIRVPGPKGASLHLQAISSAFAGLGHEVLLVAVAGHGDATLGHQSLLLPHPGRTHGLRRELRKLRFMAALPGRIQPTLEGFAPEVVYERLSLFGARGRAIADRFDAVHVVEVNALSGARRRAVAWTSSGESRPSTGARCTVARGPACGCERRGCPRGRGRRTRAACARGPKRCGRVNLRGTARP